VTSRNVNAIAFRALQIQADDRAAALQHLELRRERNAEATVRDTVYAQHSGAHLGQHHRCHRAWPDPSEFDHFDPG